MERCCYYYWGKFSPESSILFQVFGITWDTREIIESEMIFVVFYVLEFER